MSYQLVFHPEANTYVIVYKINKRKKLIYISAIYHTKRNPKYKYRKYSRLTAPLKRDYYGLF